VPTTNEIEASNSEKDGDDQDMDDYALDIDELHDGY
jgi:hypothetical protein